MKKGTDADEFHPPSNHRSVAPTVGRHTGARRIALLVGALYIVGTVAGILSRVATAPVFDDPDPLLAAAGQPNRVFVGAFLILTMGVALALIPIVLFPILREESEAMALGYVVFRSGLEAVGYLAFTVTWLVLVPLGGELATAAGDAALVRTLGTMVFEVENSISAIHTIVFSIGAILLNYLLYRSALVPRWLSVWGFLAAVPYLASGLLLGAGLIGSFSPVLIGLNLPMAIQEMVLAVWLLVRGFDPAAIESLLGHPTEGG